MTTVEFSDEAPVTGTCRPPTSSTPCAFTSNTVPVTVARMSSPAVVDSDCDGNSMVHGGCVALAARDSQGQQCNGQFHSGQSVAVYRRIMQPTGFARNRGQGRYLSDWLQAAVLR
jgi:hypothetical protein